MEYMTSCWNTLLESSSRLSDALTPGHQGCATLTPVTDATPPYTVLTVPGYDGSVEIWKFRQLFDWYPALKPLYPFKFENDWNGYPWATFCLETMFVPFILSAVYFVGIFGTQYLMRDRKPFDLKGPLALWNLGLAVFSFMGAMRTVPQLLNNLYQNDFYYSICEPAPRTFGLGAAGMWVTLFIFSKIPELFDTAFIVLRKKPLIFLHWYHHITVLLYCWHAYSVRASSGLYFVAMNYSVHAIMYFYYFAMAVNIWPKWLNPIFITFGQLSQMAVGITVCVATYYYKHTGAACAVDDSNLFWGAMMYASYFALFAEFLIKRYFFKSASKGKGKKAVDGQKVEEKKEL